MSLNSIRHGLGQAERELRRRGREPGAPEPIRVHIERATENELDALERVLKRARVENGAELQGAQRAEVEKLAAEINAREPVQLAWTPAVTPELVSAARESRATGGTVLPVTDRQLVRLAFDPSAPAEEEPPTMIKRARVPTHNRQEHEPALEPPAEIEDDRDPLGVEFARRRQAELAQEAARQARRREARRPRPEPSEATKIVERVF